MWGQKCLGLIIALSTQHFPGHRLNILQREIEPVGTLGKSSSVRRTSLQWSYQACWEAPAEVAHWGESCFFPCPAPLRVCAYQSLLTHFFFIFLHLLYVSSYTSPISISLGNQDFKNMNIKEWVQWIPQEGKILEPLSWDWANTRKMKQNWRNQQHKSSIKNCLFIFFPENAQTY